MKNNINISGIVGAIGAFVSRFHTLLYFLVISGGLFVAILMLLSIISLSSSPAGTSDKAINGTFDEATIQRLEQNPADQITPGSRLSPFVE